MGKGPCAFSCLYTPKPADATLLTSSSKPAEAVGAAETEETEAGTGEEEATRGEEETAATHAFIAALKVRVEGTLPVSSWRRMALKTNHSLWRHHLKRDRDRERDRGRQTEKVHEPGRQEKKARP